MIKELWAQICDPAESKKIPEIHDGLADSKAVGLRKATNCVREAERTPT
jgi:hypothetical protein